jgi:hypothetical protein
MSDEKQITNDGIEIPKSSDLQKGLVIPKTSNTQKQSNINQNPNIKNK